MSGTITKIPLGGSTNGRPILIAGTTAGGSTSCHVATSAGGVIDEVWAYAFNSDSVDRTITLCFGGISASDQITVNVTHQAGLFLVLPGCVLQGGLTFSAFASATNVISLTGWVNRIT